MKIFILLTAFFALAGQTLGQTAAAVKPVPEFTSARQAAFDKVWNTINEQHFDTTFGGVDWAKVRETYVPKAEAAKSDQDFHGVLNQMLSELKLSHFNVFPPPPAIDGEADGDGATGIEIIWLGGLPVVSRVSKDSPAEKAGVRTGFVVSKIDGKSVLETLKPLQQALAKRSTTDGMRLVALERTVEALISGKAATTAKIELLDADDKPRTVELARAKFAGEMSQPLGNFGKQKVIFESRLLPNNIGYIRFNIWVVPQAAKIRAAVREFAKADGIVFDVRGNPGGIGGLAGGVAGLISDKQISLGSMSSRSGTLNLIGYPQSDPYPGKIVVLTDHGSASTSEMFAAGIKENGRGKVVGDTSAGAILLSVFEVLPTGYMFQYAISDYKSPNNILIEGRGVQPDLRVLQTRAALLAGRDAQLEAAIDSILK